MTSERQSGKSETKRKIRAAGVAPRRAFMCTMPLAVTTLLGIHDALGQGRSLNIVNQCAQQVWAVFTPGAGTTQGAAQVNSGGWFQKYASQFNWTLTGFTGKSGQSSTLTVSSCPIGNGAGDCCPSGSVANPVTQCPNSSSFGVNQQIQVPLPDGTNFVTTITAVSTGGTGSSSYATLTIAPPIPNGQKVASVPISTPKAMAVSIPAGAPTLSLSVPNAGAPSQNLYFAMGNCPNGPFGGSGGTCIIGPPVGPLAGFNTLFEASFGCALDSTQSPPCAFNPSNPVCPAGAPYCGTANCSAQPTAANCGPLAPGDSYDVSAVAGYTIPMTVTVTPPAGAQCNSIDASLLDLASCPSETNKTIFSTDTVVQGVINGGVSLLAKDTSGNYQACLSPYQWFSNSVGTTANPHPTPNPKPVGSSCAFLPGGPYCTATSYYAGAGCTASMDVTSNALGCPVGGGPLGTGSPAGAQQQVGPGSPTSLQTPTGEYAIHNTYWVQQLYQMGYPGYTWSYGDATGGQGCPSIATSGQPLYPQYTVTLCPNGGTPYSKTQGWTYSSSSGLCVLSTSGGNYTSLAACQQANLKYACVNQADDSHVPNAMFQVSAKGMYSHQDIPTPTLTCKDLTLTFSGSSSSAQVPHCSFVFPADPLLTRARSSGAPTTSTALASATSSSRPPATALGCG
jgi:hypothetical protein